MIRWRIDVEASPFPPIIDPPIPGIAAAYSIAERIDITDADASVYAGEHAVFIRTNHSPLGGFQDERVIPWHRIIDYRQETTSS